jgi:hypothetical protein
MSGLEPVGAGTVARAAARAERGDQKEREVLRQLAKESGALDPAARTYAKRLAVKETTTVRSSPTNFWLRHPPPANAEERAELGQSGR